MLLLAILLSLFALIRADVNIVEPGPGDTFSGADGTVSINLKWVDNGAYPPLDKVAYYLFSLCYGPNTKIQCVYKPDTKITPDDLDKDDAGTYSYKFDIQSSMVGSGQFYVQVFAWVDGQGYTLHYTPRIELTNMGGPTTFELLTYTDTIQPVPQTSIRTGTDTNTQSFDASSVYSLPYTEQTLKTRVAPIQQQPGTKVTATTWSRRYPTSAVTFYSTFRSSLDQLSTLTPAWNYTVSSAVNYATPAAMPSDNGGWYNPIKRQSLSTRKLNVRYLSS